ncbi:MAG: beta-lactamase family protein [Planctomycetaceae bacterium]|nr:beta-lactamase family protein [Planctomycetaceae bacterium]
MKRSSITAAVMLACCVCWTPSTRANDSIDAQVEKEIADGMFLGTVVIAGTPEGVSFHKAYGRRDTGKAMTTESLFDVASITKVTTIATALAVTLDRRPDMSLDDLMRDHLPGMTGEGADRITIRYTATHRSGLDNTKSLCKQFEGERLVREILARDISWPVDSKYTYSCLGMIRLGEMLAEIHGQEFGAFCRQNIFDPLGMNDTCFGPVPEDRRDRCVRMSVACGEICDQNARRIGRPVGNAGIFTTALDLSKLATLWLNRGNCEGHRFFSETIWREFTAAGIVWHRGNGGNVPEQLSPNTFYHTGYTGQTLAIDPDRNVYVIVLTNWDHPAVRAKNEVSDLARKRIAATVFAEVLTPNLAKHCGVP